MNAVEGSPAESALEWNDVPEELLALLERVRSLPSSVRDDLEPIVREALEDARFRGRIIGVARDALERLRSDLEFTKFDLDATRREREALRKRLELGKHS